MWTQVVLVHVVDNSSCPTLILLLVLLILYCWHCFSEVIKHNNTLEFRCYKKPVKPKFVMWGICVMIKHKRFNILALNVQGTQYFLLCAFSALTLLVVPQEGHPACKKYVVMRCWRGYLSGARCKWFAYGSADATATPSSLSSAKSRMIYPSDASLPRLSWKKGR